MTVRIQFRRGTSTAWTAADTLLAEGELGLELDTGMFKVGDGVHTWNELDYSSGPRGATWFNGSGAPTSVPGAVVGDYYMDNDTGTVYQLT